MWKEMTWIRKLKVALRCELLLFVISTKLQHCGLEVWIVASRQRNLHYWLFPAAHLPDVVQILCTFGWLETKACSQMCLKCLPMSEQWTGNLSILFLPSVQTSLGLTPAPCNPEWKSEDNTMEESANIISESGYFLNFQSSAFHWVSANSV